MVERFRSLHMEGDPGRWIGMRLANAISIENTVFLRAYSIQR